METDRRVSKRNFSRSFCVKNTCVEVLFDQEMNVLQTLGPFDSTRKKAVHNLADEALYLHDLGPIQEMMLKGEREEDARRRDDLRAEYYRKMVGSEKTTSIQEAAQGKIKGSSPPGGKPEGGCSSCAEKRQKKTKAGLMKKLAKGVPGLLKSELGIDKAEPREIDRRTSICLNCPDGIYEFGVCSEERGGCGCFLASKVTIEGESCPKGHW
jgi:hypothetical protein